METLMEPLAFFANNKEQKHREGQLYLAGHKKAKTLLHHQDVLT